MKSGLAAQFAKNKRHELNKIPLQSSIIIPPQLQLMVVLGLQYAVLAKWVNGLKAAI